MADNLKREAGRIWRHVPAVLRGTQRGYVHARCQGHHCNNQAGCVHINVLASDDWRVRRGKLLCPRCAGAEKLWAVYNTSGLRHTPFFHNRDDAIAKHCSTFVDKGRINDVVRPHHWQWWYRHGYRCRRVTVYREG